MHTIAQVMDAKKFGNMFLLSCLSCFSCRTISMESTETESVNKLNPNFVNHILAILVIWFFVICKAKNKIYIKKLFLIHFTDILQLM